LGSTTPEPINQQWFLFHRCGPEKPEKDLGWMVLKKLSQRLWLVKITCLGCQKLCNSWEFNGI